jgi:hypothetical protein
VSVRRFYLDTAPGERRAVVTLDGKPERLLIDRTGEAGGPGLGGRYAARIKQSRGGDARRSACYPGGFDH